MGMGYCKRGNPESKGRTILIPHDIWDEEELEEIEIIDKPIERLISVSRKL